MACPGNYVLLGIEVLIAFAAPGAGFVCAAVDGWVLLFVAAFFVVLPLFLEVREYLPPGPAVRSGGVRAGRHAGAGHTVVSIAVGNLTGAGLPLADLVVGCISPGCVGTHRLLAG